MSTKTDTATPEHLRQCLARWVLDKHNAEGVRLFLHRWRVRHGQASHDTVRSYVATEYRHRKQRGVRAA